jgi:hypothetical protein
MINMFTEIENLCNQVSSSVHPAHPEPGSNYSITLVRRYVEGSPYIPLFHPSPARDDVAALLKHYDALVAFHSEVTSVLRSVSRLAGVKENEGACPCFERAMAAAQQKREQEHQEAQAELQRKLDAMFGPGIPREIRDRLTQRFREG